MEEKKSDKTGQAMKSGRGRERERGMGFLLITCGKEANSAHTSAATLSSN